MNEYMIRFSSIGKHGTRIGKFTKVKACSENEAVKKFLLLHNTKHEKRIEEIIKISKSHRYVRK
jgi:hypothetical protein